MNAELEVVFKMVENLEKRVEKLETALVVSAQTVESLNEELSLVNEESGLVLETVTELRSKVEKLEARKQCAECLILFDDNDHYQVHRCAPPWGPWGARIRK